MFSVLVFIRVVGKRSIIGQYGGMLMLLDIKNMIEKGETRMGFAGVDPESSGNERKGIDSLDHFSIRKLGTPSELESHLGV
jgi:hypothetical protein